MFPFPHLAFAPVENGSAWVRPMLARLEHAYEPLAPTPSTRTRWSRSSGTSTCTRSTRRTPGLVELLGADRVLFGSDYPHPEGMADPITFVDELAGLPDEDIKKVMGGNLNRLMGFPEAA